ncbi:MAG: TerB family tellurite resistance protein [Pseudomonadota bacterium]
MPDNEKPSLFGHFKTMIERDKSVRLVANDPALTAELLLLFRMILADGQVREKELEMLERICSSAFGIKSDAIDGVYKYLQDISYETSAEQAAQMFGTLSDERRQELLDHMISIAEADEELAANEVKLLSRTAEKLGFDLKTRPAG